MFGNSKYISLARFFSSSVLIAGAAACSGQKDPSTGADVNYVGIDSKFQGNLWPGGKIYYVKAGDFTWHGALEHAKRQLERTQNVRLVERPAGAKHFVTLTHSKPGDFNVVSTACGAASTVGFHPALQAQGNGQIVWLKNESLCVASERAKNAILLHEIVHTLGGDHEDLAIRPEFGMKRYNNSDPNSISIHSINTLDVKTDVLSDLDIQGINAQYTGIRPETQPQPPQPQPTKTPGPSLPQGFNVYEYGACNPDLINAFGTEMERYRQHYLASGKTEGRRYANCFDGLAYIAGYPDLIGAFGANAQKGIEHFVSSGFKEGRTIGKFNCNNYLQLYADLRAAFGNDCRAATKHWIEHGLREGRVGLDSLPQGFNVYEYGACNPDLINAFGTEMERYRQHYLASGKAEGRRYANCFDGLAYIAGYPDLIGAFGANAQKGIEHFVTSGFKEGRTIGKFNCNSYLQLYADLRAAFGNDCRAATKHWIEHGLREGRVGLN